jgi:hypothetical protein
LARFVLNATSIAELGIVENLEENGGPRKWTGFDDAPAADNSRRKQLPHSKKRGSKYRVISLPFFLERPGVKSDMGKKEEAEEEEKKKPGLEFEHPKPRVAKRALSNVTNSGDEVKAKRAKTANSSVDNSAGSSTDGVAAIRDDSSCDEETEDGGGAALGAKKIQAETDVVVSFGFGDALVIDEIHHGVFCHSVVVVPSPFPLVVDRNFSL